MSDFVEAAENMKCRETVKRCEGAECNGTAVARVFWPGRPPLNMCQACVQKVRAVSHHLGAYVHIEALEGFVEIPLDELTKEALGDV